MDSFSFGCSYKDPRFHSEVLGVRTSTHEFGRDTIQPITGDMCLFSLPIIWTHNVRLGRRQSSSVIEAERPRHSQLLCTKDKGLCPALTREMPAQDCELFAPTTTKMWPSAYFSPGDGGCLQFLGTAVTSSARGL